MLERTPRRGFLRLIASIPLVTVALTSAGTTAKKRKKPAPRITLDGYSLSPWKTKTVIVQDAMPERWHSINASMVDAINAVMPASGPRLVYEAAPHRICSGVEEEPKVLGMVRMCDKREDTEAATAWTDLKKGRITYGVISIPDGWFGGGEEHRVSCHELLHTMLHVVDRYPDDDLKDSCVLGMNPAPGTWDKAALEKVYG